MSSPRPRWSRGWLRLWLLDVDGGPRAACYGFRFGGVECFYQSGRDPAWDSSSVGFLVLLHAVRAALAAVGLRVRRHVRSVVARALSGVVSGALTSAYEVSSAVAITW